ncbi:hypothetical protein HAX54_037193 [Datura stramonium]|uniref:STAS domain-containing protein n=1 Tax=Datura stramonium TaxID=4076 RepID=A0ABS8VKT8_DATST|nr:hypothetical protein [Datura stramonium]
MMQRLETDQNDSVTMKGHHVSWLDLTACGLVQRVTEELTTHQPFDSPSHRRFGSDGRNECRQDSDRPLCLTSKLDGEGDGSSA